MTEKKEYSFGYTKDKLIRRISMFSSIWWGGIESNTEETLQLLLVFPNFKRMLWIIMLFYSRAKFFTHSSTKEGTWLYGRKFICMLNNYCWNMINVENICFVRIKCTAIIHQENQVAFHWRANGCLCGRNIFSLMYCRQKYSRLYKTFSPHLNASVSRVII